ncbi:hypothetical protein E2C01_091136 [Portunus trituberculatus]|uniref:Uncharacterized protein n=1 Tax=Portunus trituberculatus TaxID=210409 RepID=A0A5B7JNK9_PORTR|nr:hypothetical protein [Portunus trituberculatus]
MRFITIRPSSSSRRRQNTTQLITRNTTLQTPRKSEGRGFVFPVYGPEREMGVQVLIRTENGNEGKVAGSGGTREDTGGHGTGEEARRTPCSAQPPAHTSPQSSTRGHYHLDDTRASLRAAPEASTVNIGKMICRKLFAEGKSELQPDRDLVKREGRAAATLWRGTKGCILRLTGGAPFMDSLRETV